MAGGSLGTGIQCVGGGPSVSVYSSSSHSVHDEPFHRSTLGADHLGPIIRTHVPSLGAVSIGCQSMLVSTSFSLQNQGFSAMKLLTITAAALALGACQTTRYVSVPCVGKDQVLPAEPERVGDKLTGRADRDFQIIAGSNARLRSYGQGLRTILEGCRG